MAVTFGVNRSTAREMSLDNLEKGVESPRGGRNNVLVDDEVMQCLQDMINEKCVLTERQINGELKKRLPAKRLIHDRTVARNLERMLSRVKQVRPVLADRTDMMFCKEGKKLETGSSIMPLCATMFLSMSAVTTSGLSEITGGRGRVCVHIDKCETSEDGT